MSTMSKPSWMSDGFYSRRPKSKLDDVINCLGCFKQFKAQRGKSNGKLFPELDFYVHCIEQCPDYARLDLVRECLDCQLKFISPRAAECHSKYCPSSKAWKRSWMSAKVISQSSMSLKYDSKINCRGCNQEFPARSTSKSNVQPRMDYYVHCVEQCPKFKELGLIFECPKCELIFLNKAEHRTCDDMNSVALDHPYAKMKPKIRFRSKKTTTKSRFKDKNSTNASVRLLEETLKNYKDGMPLLLPYDEF